MDFSTSNSTIVSATVGLQTGSVDANGNIVVSGLSYPVPSGLSATNIPVTVTYKSIPLTGPDYQTSTLTLTAVKSQSGTSGVVTSGTLNIPSNTMHVVASKPTVALAGVSSITTMSGTAAQNIISVSVKADEAGDVDLLSLPLTITTSGSGLTPIRNWLFIQMPTLALFLL